MERCEVRVPTYKRPQLLKRALDSLIAQDYPHWIALVMDDSPAQEANAIAASYEDDRILYSPNSKNLGSAGNLDRAFTTQELVGGTYACVLEDDNWLMPTYLSENIALLKEKSVNLLMRNQEIWLQTEQQSQPTGRTTRGDWFTARLYTPYELYAYLFLLEGASNGGLFWKTSMQTNLQVGSQVVDAGLQEYCRSLQIEDDFYFAPKPLCYWSEMPVSLSLRNPASDRVFGRGVQSIRMHLIQNDGQEVIETAEKLAFHCNKRAEFEWSLIDALYIQYHFQYVDRLKAAKSYLKSYAKFKLVKNPLESYLTKGIRK
ncbi:MAG: glycosyltransferase family 2 protein [Leptolyngbyaceae cyanobacterium SM1_3_5]|nr:glycosyltransferase family 2 protein [Leptolyngbyaceae cyanobacterium SM1_3_5]